MAHVLVVGSGPSGVQFALSALRKGHRVTLVDGGRSGTAAPLPEADFSELKRRLDDPAAYFLGDRFEGVILPSEDKEYYGIPPHRQYIIENPHAAGWHATGFEPLVSFARGGFAEAWTGGCYPFNDAELADFPITFAQLAPYYDEVARRIGITGEADDLARFFPLHDHLLPPLRLDEHSATLLRSYRRHRRVLNGRLQCYMGRTRVATLSRPDGTRSECGYLGRCLLGCPNDALWVPSLTLRECMGHEAFRYEPGWHVRYFRLDAEGQIGAVVATPLEGGTEREFTAERFVLAAGTLASTRIVLESVRRRTGESAHCRGLMDNRQILAPFLNLRMLGHGVAPDTYQYHLIGMGIAMPDSRQYVHGQITTLTTALMHPIIQKLPFDLATSAAVARTTHAALGVVNLNFHDSRREGNTVTLEPDGGSDFPALRIRYSTPDGEAAHLQHALRTLKRAFRRLGCIVPPGMLHVRPMGASVHYAGTMPMTRAPGRFTTTADCRSRDFPNLWVVDGSTFPFLPAKNITFTLMANAARVADAAF